MSINAITYKTLQSELETWLDDLFTNGKLGNSKEPAVLNYIFSHIEDLEKEWKLILDPLNLKIQMKAFLIHNQPKIEYYLKDPKTGLLNSEPEPSIEFGDLLFIYTYRGKGKKKFKRNSIAYQAKLFKGQVTSSQLEQYAHWHVFDFTLKDYIGTKYDLKVKGPHDGARYLFIDNTYLNHGGRAHLVTDALKTATPDMTLMQKNSHLLSNCNMIDEIMGLFIDAKGLPHNKNAVWAEFILKVEQYCDKTPLTKRNTVTAKQMNFSKKTSNPLPLERLDYKPMIMVTIDLMDDN